jgi:imidazolonepropionase-like amidohydrolase
VNAEILRLEDRIGRVAKGFVADLIVVDGDPLSDLSLLGDPEGTHIPLVMQSGQIVKRSGALAPGH